MIDLTDSAFAKAITSHFGPRTAPTSGASTNHKGVDIVLKNTSVPSIFSGIVTASGYDNSRGNYVTVKNADGTKATYMHLKTLSPYSAGDSVNEGSIIGTEGSTGLSTGTHLHLGIQNSEGDYIDPETYLKGATSMTSASGGDNRFLENSPYFPTSSITPAESGQTFLGQFGQNSIVIILIAACAFLAYKFFMTAFEGTTAIQLVKGEN